MSSNIKKILIISVICLALLWLVGLTVAISFGLRADVSAEKQLSTASKPATVKPVSITWYGYNAFKLTCESKNILIDPWITRNQQSPIKIEDTFPVDLILISDGHDEYVGDSIAIAKKTGAKVVTTPDIATELKANGLPAENIIFDGSGINIGGQIQAEGINILMTQAVHSSTANAPTGFIIQFPGGATVYYAGNTGIFSDMRLLAELYPIHVALLPIGGISSMDAYQAAESLRLLKPSKVIPMHFGAFSNLAPNSDEFLKIAMQGAPETEVVILKPGQSYILKPGTYR
jgi:L-ascorbate metabolism protein UlaG (beta-lactamase superfamily)